MSLKRTQIYLEPEQHRLLKEEAKAKGVSLAELLRQVARNYLHQEPRREDFGRIVGLGKGDVDNAAEEHDRYIEGAVTRE